MIKIKEKLKGNALAQNPVMGRFSRVFLSIRLLKVGTSYRLNRSLAFYLLNLYCLTNTNELKLMFKMLTKVLTFGEASFSSSFLIHVSMSIRANAKFAQLTTLKALALLTKLFSERINFYKKLKKKDLFYFTTMSKSANVMNKKKIQQQSSQQMFRAIMKPVNWFLAVRIFFFIIIPLVWRKNLVSEFILKETKKLGLNRSHASYFNFSISDIPQILSYMNINLVYDYFDWENTKLISAMIPVYSFNDAITHKQAKIPPAIIEYLSMFRVI